MNITKLTLIAFTLTAGASFAQPSRAQTVRSSEDFFNTLGVNIHIGG